MVEFETEWRRLMSTNLEFQAAVVTYRELENDFDRARGETIRIPIPSFTPIGDNVFLESVRVRNLTCTCEGPTQ